MDTLKNIITTLRDERILNSCADIDEFQQGVIYGLTIALNHIKEMEDK